MLPIEQVLEQIFAALAEHQNLVLQAPPGAGKSTFLPLALLKQNSIDGKIIMLEPRRLAARSIAHYIASQLGESVGQQVGYRIRQETKVSQLTRLEIVTEGVLTRMIQQDPTLDGIGLVIFDEFHERSIDADLALSLCLEIQEALRDDLKLLVMSATLDSEYLAKFLAAPVVTSEGRSYPVDVHYFAAQSDLAQLTIKALNEESGSILLFLPGAWEIRQLEEQLNAAQLADNIKLYPLYGDLSKDLQQAAIAPCEGNERKVVLATNIAETSLTIDGIRVVIDSGQKRLASFNPKNGVTKLVTTNISKSSAIQRAGRAGRLMAGCCYRLGSQELFDRRADFDKPEIINSDLTSLLLEITHWGGCVEQMQWLNKPPKALIAQAAQLLRQLEIVEGEGDGYSSSLKLTALGKDIIALGTHPRIGHMLIKAQVLSKQLDAQLLSLACYLAAMVEEVDPLPKAMRQDNVNIEDRVRFVCAGKSAVINKQAKHWAKRVNIKLSSERLPLHYCGLLLALAYPDRMAKSRGQGYQLSNGFGVTLSHNDPLVESELLVVADLVEFDSRSFVGMAAKIEFSDIEQYLPHLIEFESFVGWDNSGEKLIAERRVKLGKITLSSKPIQGVVTTEQRTQAFVNLIRQKGLTFLGWNDENKQLLIRLQTAHELMPEVYVSFAESVLIDELENWLAPFIADVKSVPQLKQLDLAQALLSRLDWNTQQQLNNDFPERFLVPVGSRYKIEYRQGQNPKLSVRIQEMFGLTETPTLAGGRLPLVIELLSPARRPLQLTQDLAGFWQGSYEQVKKEMKGRYPKHYWPDDPSVAMPTSRVKSKM